VRATPAGGEKLLDSVPALLDAAAASGGRLGMVGGAAGLLVSEDGPRLFDTPDFHEEWKQEAGNQISVLEALRASDATANLFYISPPAIYGSFVPGERTGTYRIGGDVLLTDPAGKSTIGGEDFAAAILDELDRQAHHRQRFTVAY
jgi:putative NADH-flavin reductase